MATDTKMNEKKLRLLSLLREMFQLDQPDLDFGLYRIMHAKRAQVETFLETEFDQLIDKVFGSRGARQEEAAKQEYEAARQQATEFGAPDPDAAPKVQQARARYDAVRLTGGEDAEIYDHLHRFFSRYYDQGDFMSLRRYGKGAAGGAETYAVPYDGSEVVLHWANKDQYYIKTTENFAEFSFDPKKALQKDEKGISRQLFDDDANGQALKVHFRIVDAAEGAHNNVKASDKDERYFILDDETPIAWEGTELVVRIQYRPDAEKTGQKGKWQEKRNDQLVQKVLQQLGQASREGGNPDPATAYHAALSREVPKGKDKKQALLARYIGQYTASNTMDYFIHKDLGGFLRRELDFYLKNEVLKLDDFVGSEDADVQAGLSDARMKAMKEALEKVQAIRLLSQRLIDFLAQLEDFQKKLWLKKKFVVETHYCLTLDRIPEQFYSEIAANERQREEWVDQCGIDKLDNDLTQAAYSVPLTTTFLHSHPSLMVDTQHFAPPFSERLLAAMEGLDETLDGILTFVRKPDPLLPEDANTRLQVVNLSEIPLTPTLSPEERGSQFVPSPPAPLPEGEGSKSWWFRPVEGYVRTKPGDDRHRQSVLVLWRTLTDDPEQDAAALEAFLAQQMKFDPSRREDKTLYDIIYINGTHNLPNLGKYGEVRLLEEEFHRRMWAQEEV